MTKQHRYLPRAMLSRGTVLNGRWTIGDRIGEGSCGEVYAAVEKDPDVGDVVIKVCRIPTGKKSKADKDQMRILGTLDWERNLYYNRFRGLDFLPSVPLRNGYGTDKGMRYIVVQRLDFDLTKLVEGGHPVSLNDVSLIGQSIIQGLERLHSLGFLFVDMKPDNFMIKKQHQQRPQKKKSDQRDKPIFLPEDNFYFVDFGLAAKMTTYQGQGDERVREKVTGRVTGTPSFLSVDTLSGWTECRKDDIESLGYILLYLSQGGRLPWDDAGSDAEILSIKKNADFRKITKTMGCPEIGEVIMSARELSPQETPDYSHFNSLIQALAGTSTSRSSRSSSSGVLSRSAVRERNQEDPIPSGPKSRRGKRASAQISAQADEEDGGRGDSALGGGQRAKRTRDASKASTRGRATPSARSARGGSSAKRVPIIDLTEDSARDIDPAVESPRGPFSSPPAPGARKGRSSRGQSVADPGAVATRSSRRGK